MVDFIFRLYHSFLNRKIKMETRNYYTSGSMSRKELQRISSNTRTFEGNTLRTYGRNLVKWNIEEPTRRKIYEIINMRRNGISPAKDGINFELYGGQE